MYNCVHIPLFFTRLYHSLVTKPGVETSTSLAIAQLAKDTKSRHMCDLGAKPILPTRGYKKCCPSISANDPWGFSFILISGTNCWRWSDRESAAGYRATACLYQAYYAGETVISSSRIMACSLFVSGCQASIHACLRPIFSGEKYVRTVPWGQSRVFVMFSLRERNAP